MKRHALDSLDLTMLLEHHQKKDGVMIEKCEVKQVRKGNKLEAMLGKQIDVSPSKNQALCVS